MSKGDKKPTESKSKLSKSERWGQRCLMFAVILNGMVLLTNLRVSSLNKEYDSKIRERQEFITNHQAISFEIAKQSLIHTGLNQLKILRRLSKSFISPTENAALLIDERNLAGQIEASNSKIVAGTYIQGHDLPQDADLNKMFSGLSQDSLEKLFPIYQQTEMEAADKLTNELTKLDNKLSFWKPIYSFITVLSMSVIVIGSILLFRAGKSAKPEIPKPT